MTRAEWKAQQRANGVGAKIALIVRGHRIMRQMEQAVPRLDHEEARQVACGWVEGALNQAGGWARAISWTVIRHVGKREHGARARAADAREALKHWLRAIGRYETRVKVSWARTLPEDVQAAYGARKTWWAKAKTSRVYPLTPERYKQWENEVWRRHYDVQRRLRAQTTDQAPWTWKA